jgi:hypothetical protein
LIVDTIKLFVEDGLDNGPKVGTAHRDSHLSDLLSKR